MKKFLKEPLLHFMLIGAGLFGLYAQVNQDGVIAEDKLVITEGRIEQWVNVYQKTWQRVPNEAELKALVDDYVIEEIYYRQAVAMGIDQDDLVIRRRMRQKLEFLTDDVLLAREASDEELQAFMEERADVFREDPKWSFEHVYINPPRHGELLEKHIEQVRDRLSRGEQVESDSYFIAREQSRVPSWKVDRDFGKNLSDKLAAHDLGIWCGPVESGLGVHFVKVSKREPGGIPELTLVRDRVLREWLNAQKLKRREEFNQKFLDQYEIVIEWPKAKSDA